MEMMIRCRKDWGLFAEGLFYEAELVDFAEVADWETGEIIQGRRLVVKSRSGIEIAIAEITTPHDWEFVSGESFQRQWQERQHLGRIKFEWWNYFEIIATVESYLLTRDEEERP